MAVAFRTNCIEADIATLCTVIEDQDSTTSSSTDTTLFNHLSTNPGWLSWSPMFQTQVQELYRSNPQTYTNFETLSPTAPAIECTIQKNLFKPHQIHIQSSSRTLEVYRSNEYLGSFRGVLVPGSKVVQPSSSSSPSPSSSSSSSSLLAPLPPVYEVFISLSTTSFGNKMKKEEVLMIKFPVPKKQGVADQRGVYMKLFVVVGKYTPEGVVIIPKSGMTTTSTTTTTTSSVNGADSVQSSLNLLGNNNNNNLMTFSSGIQTPISYESLSDHGSEKGSNTLSFQHQQQPQQPRTGLMDMEKIREMIGKVGIENLPPGAKDLMKTMEINSSVQQNQMEKVEQQIMSVAEKMMSGSFGRGGFVDDGSRSSGGTSKVGLVASSPSPLCLPPTFVAAAATAAANGTALSGSSMGLVNNYQGNMELDEKIRQMEERIMNRLDLKLKEMEDRLMDQVEERLARLKV